MSTISPPSASSTLADIKQYREDTDDKLKMEEDLQRKVDETIQRIRDTSEQLQAVALPYAQKTRDFAEDKPVLFTFIVIFGLLSAIPTLCFATFLLASTIFILGVAAIGICLSILGTILFASAILLPVLLFTLVSSIFILSFLLGLFLAHRLYLHLTIAAENETDKATYLTLGAKNWAEETKARVPLLRSTDKPSTDVEEVKVKQEVEVKLEDGKVTGLRLRGV